MVARQQIAHRGNPPLPISSEMLMREDAQEENYRDIQNILQLSRLGQELCTQTSNQASYLCEEVKRITQNRAHLHLHKNSVCRHPSSSLGSTLLPVQFGDITYGVLYINMDRHYHSHPALALPVARLLAQVCAFLLHLFEQSLFLRVQYEHLDYHISGPLTRREREVLSLMYKGYTEVEIAEELSISPTTVNKHRQNIYGQLGVHNEYDARLVAYHMRMFPIVDEYEQVE